MLFGAACVAARPAPWPWFALAALVAVLGVKAGVEERLMLLAHPGYAAYRARTRRFLPGLV
jgi:protein-S-isoprenylcysteine O-methyltransferase Ste14